MSDEVVSILHLAAPNNTSGNPRRLFIGLDKSGHVVRITDEGYTGRPDWVRDANNRGLWEFHAEVPPSTYTRWKKHTLFEEA